MSSSGKGSPRQFPRNCDAAAASAQMCKPGISNIQTGPDCPTRHMSSWPLRLSLSVKHWVRQATSGTHMVPRQPYQGDWLHRGSWLEGPLPIGDRLADSSSTHLGPAMG
ncbi:uncharacterized protein QC763_0046380 [Podospora pseudopauciseta]|uniref:Uncharacterized protein n=1 Tax=Podospora pseudopauciseta TaxID=2093780 RepID=A0ABR0HJX7_9PEZI|nr:hypothetical protein QC763_0046380 [Podospora pseudopauciseta]